MTPHDRDEEHRAATPLELFFDLVFVIAVAASSAGLHHGLVAGHATEAVIGFLTVFFAIWWAWMNFTWFASAYGTDDVPYRIAVFVIMIGALILAAGVADYAEGQRFGVVVGYVVMRVAMIALWLRAAAADRDGRACALRYAIGIGILQVLWVARLAIADTVGPVSFLVLALAELCVPYWAESAGRIAWHPRHIAERYALFTLIVLGEALLAATQGVRSVLAEDTHIGHLVTIIIGGLLLVFSMWWIYFDLPTESVISAAHRDMRRGRRVRFFWAYGHYFIFGSIAATGAGITVAVDHAANLSQISEIGVGLAVAIPVSIFLVAVWGLESPLEDPISFRTWAIPIAIALLVASCFTPEPVLLSGIVLTVLLIAGTAAVHWRPLIDRSTPAA